MMKPGISSYERFRKMFEKYSREAGKEQYLIPYFIAAHPGTTDEDMINLALWLKRSGFKADQVQAFYPSPMATATAMYHSGKNPLRKVSYKSEKVSGVKDPAQRKLHKALLRYHDPDNWELIRKTLRKMGRADLIGDGERQLVPDCQPDTTQSYRASRRKNTKQAHERRTGKKILTQHTGLPPRETGDRRQSRTGKKQKIKRSRR